MVAALIETGLRVFDKKEFIKGMAKLPCFALATGSVMYVPFGFVPFIMGVAADAEMDDPDFCQMVVYTVLDKDTSQMDADVQVEVSATVTKAMQRLKSKVVGQWKKEVAEFVQTLSQAKGPSSSKGSDGQ
jgi:post-segregation antitoxin (ccd killing protein)